MQQQLYLNSPVRLSKIVFFLVGDFAYDMDSIDSVSPPFYNTSTSYVSLSILHHSLDFIFTSFRIFNPADTFEILTPLLGWGGGGRPGHMQPRQ